jgi:predicted RNase H-like HicB family nuclease
MKTRRYGVVIERGPDGFGGYVPDLPGCVTTGATPEEVRSNLVQAISLHLHGMWEDGDPLPEPASEVDYVAVPDDPHVWAEGVEVVEQSAAIARKS